MSKTASALTAATLPLGGTELTYVVQGGNSRQTPVSSFYIPGGTDVAVLDGGTGASTASGARTNLGLAIGTDVQAFSANLASWAAVTRAAGADTFFTTPSSANLRALLTDEVGTGAAYFVGGALGTPASGTATNLTGLPIGTGISGLAANMATFLAGGTSAQLIAAVTDETGTGSLVFATSPTLVTPALGTPASGVMTNVTGLPLTTGITGTLLPANGGTGVTLAGSADVDKRLVVNAAGTGFDKVYIGNIGYPSRFGTYDRTGVSDSSAAINSALSSYKYVELGEGTFNIGTTTLTYPADGRRLYGVGKKRTILRPTSTNAAAISIPTGRVNCELIGVTVDRNAVAVSGGDGLVVGQSNITNIRDVEFLNNYIGMNLSAVGFGQIDDYFIHDNYNHGILISNSAALGTCQWYIGAGLIQGNDGWGAIVASANTGPTSLLLGDWDGVKTFGNTSGGVAFAAVAAVPILGVRLKNSFIGGDGAGGEVFLDTFGGLHCIENVFAESAGQGGTGRNAFATAAAGIGHGINVTANNTDVTINSCKALSNKSSGMTLAATAFNTVHGGYSRNNTQWGITCADGAKTRIEGVAIDTNTSGSIFATANATSLKVEGCFPDSLNSNGQRTGTATNDSAATGNVGEYVESVIASGSAVALVTATAKDVTTISLTAGDWDVEFISEFTGGGTTTVNYLVGSVSSGATNTLDQTNGRFVAHNFAAATLFNAVPGGLFGFAGVTVRFSLSATTTIRAVAQAAFGVSTCSAYGLLRARRVR